jgi:hypothetical protein
LASSEGRDLERGPPALGELDVLEVLGPDAHDQNAVGRRLRAPARVQRDAHPGERQLVAVDARLDEVHRRRSDERRHQQVGRLLIHAEGVQVALPDRRLQARLSLGQGRPTASADPARDASLAQALPGRAAVEREFGRLKNEWALLPLRVRGLERVQLHADLTILAKLACAVARARAVPLAA